MAPRSKPGYFFGEPLKLLTEYVPLYLSTALTKKQDFWTQFNPVWAEAFEQLDEDEKGELEDLRISYKDEKETVQRENKEARRKHRRRKAVLQSLPTPSARLNELRARGADDVKIKSWFSNQKTKDKTRKVEPFRAWLSKITSLQGSPRRLQIGWVMWRDPKYGEVLRARYQKYKKEADEEEDEDADRVDPFEKEGSEDQASEDQTDASRGVLLQCKLRLALAYFKELSGDEKTGLAEAREEDFEARRKAYESTLKDEAECSVAELDERRRHVEAISHRALEALCTQMKCQGLLILGEISEGDKDELFLSMVHTGSLPKHPSIDFMKKDEQGTLGSLTDPGPPHTVTPSLCVHCLGSLSRLDLQPPPNAEGAAASKQKAAPVQKSAPVKKKAPVRKSARLGKGKGKGRGKKKSTEEEEEEAMESGAEEEEEEEEWGAGRSEEEEEDERDELESSARATPLPEGDRGEDDGDEEGGESTLRLRREPNLPMQRALEAMTADAARKEN
ncbi:hypothetical protein B0H14DRAFT_3451173 [Mycena olivaceomarginata]|nr:hypothetical protein B0H14DRAFT_3451173 [Mycena olivaceomarginata]